MRAILTKSKNNSGDNYLIISGHRRAKIAKELGIKVPCIIRTDLKEDWQIKEALIKDNLLRRQLSDYQKVRCGLELEPIERLKAKKRQIEAGRLYGEKHPKEEVKENFPQALSSEKGQTRDIVAKEVGFGSGRQYESFFLCHKKLSLCVKYCKAGVIKNSNTDATSSNKAMSGVFRFFSSQVVI